MSSAMVTIVCLAMGKLVPVRADRIKQLAEPARLRRLPAARSALLLTTPRHTASTDRGPTPDRRQMSEPLDGPTRRAMVHRLAPTARSTNIALSHGLDEVFGTHRLSAS